MLKNVKSIYFLRLIFSFVDEKQKLELIKYNKNLQENMNITLINYKYFKGEYIINESKGKRKVYDYDDILLFEGEYLNGKRIGKGKVYEDGKLIFECEYLDNKRMKGNVYENYGKL